MTSAVRRPNAPSPDPAVLDEVLRGLRATPKTIAPKFFYDDRGSRLFEKICQLPEYYPTRAELEILAARGGEIADLAGPRCAVVEYGSGAALKTRLLLQALEQPASYTPIEIARAQALAVTDRLRRDFPDIEMHPVVADYTKPFTLPPLPPHARRLAFFPGSTIGNFHPVQAAAFLQRVRGVVGDNGAMVLGVDRRKDPATIEAAYNDAAGVTAAFNLNVLQRLNRELGADFVVEQFRHRAFFNDEASRVEMHLESLDDQRVTIGGEGIDFARGETIWTESSYKYDRDRLERLAESAGFRIAQLWTDVADLFWVAFLYARVTESSRVDSRPRD